MHEIDWLVQPSGLRLRNMVLEWFNLENELCASAGNIWCVVHFIIIFMQNSVALKSDLNVEMKVSDFTLNNHSII